MARTQLADSWKDWARLNRGKLAETEPTAGGVQPSNILANETADLAADLAAAAAAAAAPSPP